MPWLKHNITLLLKKRTDVRTNHLSADLKAVHSVLDKMLESEEDMYKDTLILTDYEMYFKAEEVIEVSVHDR